MRHLLSLILLLTTNYVEAQKSITITKKDIAQISTYDIETNKNIFKAYPDTSNYLVNPLEIKKERVIVFPFHLNIIGYSSDYDTYLFHSIFKTGITITNSEFKQFDFSSNNVYGNAYISGSFNSNSDFTFTNFNSSTDFRYSHFSDSTSFYYVNFKSTASFNCTFAGATNFYATKFWDDAIMNSTNFVGKVYFDLTEFKGRCSFRYATFEKTPSFNGTVFSDFTDFTNSDFLNDTIDFSDVVVLNEPVDFTKIKLKEEKRVYINLLNTSTSKVKIDYLNFELFFPGNTSAEKKKIIYEGLLGNFKQNGQVESFKNLDIEYHTKILSQESPLLNGISKYWWNYGYNKELIFVWAFFFTILLTLTTFFCLDFLNSYVYKMENIPIQGKILKGNYKKYMSSFVSRLWYSFVYTTNIFFRLNLKAENLIYKKKLGVFYVMFVYTLGLICLAYMANFVLQK